MACTDLPDTSGATDPTITVCYTAEYAWPASILADRSRFETDKAFIAAATDEAKTLALSHLAFEPTVVEPDELDVAVGPTVQAGTYFTAADVATVLADGDDTAESTDAMAQWLARHADRVVEAMARAGFEAIETLLTIDPLQETD